MKKTVSMKAPIKLEPWLGYETRYDGKSEYGCPVVVWLPDNTRDPNKAAWMLFMKQVGYIDAIDGDARAKYNDDGVVDLGDGRSVEFDLKDKLTLEEYTVLDKCCIWDGGRGGRSILDLKRTPLQQKKSG